MHRSPGVFFDHDFGKTHTSGKYLYNARIIPYRGSWLDFEHDAKNNIHARIDRKRKFPVTTLLKCLLSFRSENYINQCEENKIDPDPKKILGMSSEEILSTFYENIQYKKDKFGWKYKINLSFYKAKILNYDLLDPKNGKTLLSKGTKVNQKHIRELESKVGQNLCIENNSLIGLYIASDIIDEKSGKIFKSQTSDRDRRLRSQIIINNNKTKKDFIFSAERVLMEFLK